MRNAGRFEHSLIALTGAIAAFLVSLIDGEGTWLYLSVVLLVFWGVLSIFSVSPSVHFKAIGWLEKQRQHRSPHKPENRVDLVQLSDEEDERERVATLFDTQVNLAIFREPKRVDPSDIPAAPHDTNTEEAIDAKNDTRDLFALTLG